MISFYCIQYNLVSLDAVQETEEANVTSGIKHGPVFENQVSPARIVDPNHQTEASKETIPVNGTLLSAGFVVLLIVINIISMGVTMDDLKRTLIIKLISDIFRAVRCPTIAFVTYQARTTMAQRNVD